MVYNSYKENEMLKKIIKYFKKVEFEYSNDPEETLGTLYNTVFGYNDINQFSQLLKDLGEKLRYYILYWNDYPAEDGTANYYLKKLYDENDIDNCFTYNIKEAYLFQSPLELENFISSDEFYDMWALEEEADERKIMIIDEDYNIIAEDAENMDIWNCWEMEDWNK